jgi:hypothetical protein
MCRQTDRQTLVQESLSNCYHIGFPSNEVNWDAFHVPLTFYSNVMRIMRSESNVKCRQPHLTNRNMGDIIAVQACNKSRCVFPLLLLVSCSLTLISAIHLCAISAAPRHRCTIYVPFLRLLFAISALTQHHLHSSSAPTLRHLSAISAPTLRHLCPNSTPSPCLLCAISALTQRHLRASCVSTLRNLCSDSTPFSCLLCAISVPPLLASSAPSLCHLRASFAPALHHPISALFCTVDNVPSYFSAEFEDSARMEEEIVEWDHSAISVAFCSASCRCPTVALLCFCLVCVADWISFI